MPQIKTLLNKAFCETACPVILDDWIKLNSLSEIKQQARSYFRRLLFCALIFTSQNTMLDMLTFQFILPSKPRQPHIRGAKLQYLLLIIIIFVKKM